ncbi:general odorant-binding protein 56d-like [Bactrocera neohumeralis]|uniref:general odorant-binding protein 56d-like n=1 Tax=Bactrocera tryoni TaxID=59916 RepID=UPI001A9674D9|nr:general odorant-binding protein 56d-like [Bactrocera tryoni]XP_050323075.1 general odorant-binding protein 56d-like [Bactrocera neohumeralis]
MKFFAVAVLLALVAVAAAQESVGTLTEEQIQKARTLTTECLKETGAAEEAIRALIRGDDSQVDGKVKCYAKCTLGKLGYVENGKVNEKNVQNFLGKLIGEDKAKAIQAKCNGLKGTDECDTAYQIRQCYAADYHFIS